MAGARAGMVCVETLSKVRRGHFVRGRSIRQISRERGAFVARLEEMLEANERRRKRERLPLTRILEDLHREGYRGGYDSVRRYAKRWRQARTMILSEAYVQLSFAPGSDALPGGLFARNARDGVRCP